MTVKTQKLRVDGGKVASGIGWLVLVTIISLWLVSLQNERMPVQVIGAGDFVSATEVERVVAPWVGRGFFSVDLDRIREAVINLAWVRDVEIVRHWPGVVQISVNERRALARWGDKALLSDEFVIFEPDVLPMLTLARLRGPEGSQWEVARVYLDAVSRLQPLGYEVVMLELNDQNNWSLALNDSFNQQSAGISSPLIVNLGGTSPAKQLEIFEKSVIAALGSRIGDAARIDLQYDHGFAVQWRSLSGELS